MDEHYEITDQEKQMIDAAGVNLAEAFHEWRMQREAPEDRLDIQKVSDAWDLVMLRLDQYTMATAKVRAIKYGGGMMPCKDCP